MKKTKTLHIVRHAKSSWDYQNISDYDRPLKLRGIVNAYEMARRVKIRNSSPDYIITSPANRAFHTASVFARVIEIPFSQFRVDSDLYGSDIETIINLLKNIDDKFKNVMIFGHNPEFTELANQFAKHAIENISTCGIVSITFNVDEWKNIAKEHVKEVVFDFPKNELQV
ncbi:MAG: histidine phosphatase family protein [Bacteroidales bacterium]|nr:histidine phosphatase family protein [Bacteroidales bacterium]